MQAHPIVTAESPLSDAEASFIPLPSTAMRAIESMLAELGASDIPVLLMGEPGVGKGAVARRIHQLSSRRHRALVKVRCADLSTEALEAALGRHDEADDGPSGGTLILDGVGDLPGACQGWLLNGSRLNGARGAWRMISTSSRNLAEEKQAGRFSDELYYRLSGVSLHLPPLCHRREDIAPLAGFFAEKYADLFGQPALTLGPDVLGALAEYDWPGNVRELETVVRRMAALGDGKAVVASLGAAAPPGNGHTQPLRQVAREASRQAERELILKVLAETRWNRKRAAQRLQISYKALLYKLKQIGLKDVPA